MTTDHTDPCPCGGGPYDTCCGPWHRGGDAPTAEALMRSRYSAYVHRDVAHLLRTSHPMLRLKTTAKDLLATAALGWCGLTIVTVRGGGPGDSEGMVHFRASHRGGVLEERSRFVRERGAWVYRDGRG